MRRLLVFQHVPFEILGTLNSLLKARGFRIRYANFGRHPEAHPKVTGYNGLVVLGGPMNVDDLKQHPHLAVEVELIRQAIDQGLANGPAPLDGQDVAADHLRDLLAQAAEPVANRLVAGLGPIEGAAEPRTVAGAPSHPLSVPI